MASFEELMGRQPRRDGEYTPLSALAPFNDDDGYADLARHFATTNLWRRTNTRGSLRRQSPSLRPSW